MKFIKYRLIYSMLLLTCMAVAQKSQIKEADRKFEDLAYIDAVEIYESVANNGYEDEDILRRLGDAYYFNADYTQAAKWYRKLNVINPNNSLESNFRYGQALKAIGNYTDADKFLGNFYKAQGLNYRNSNEYLNEIEKNSNRYIVESVSFNTKNSDYPAFYNQEQLYVVSSDTVLIKTPWNNEPTTDIFLLKNGLLSSVEGDVNTKYNEGSIAITKDGNTMYFTRNNYTNSKLGKDEEKTIRLKLYKAQLVDGVWKDEVELPFNSDYYSVGHPTLNMDESKLYFVSDMPSNGNRGGTDIYEVALFADGGYGAPFNMSGFNTAGNEMFPFVAKDGIFYFSSNGHQSNLGGLDVYSSKSNADGVYGKVSNIGKPVNSPMDDFAFVINSESNSGYFSTNRNGTSSDDIHSFKQNGGYVVPCEVMLRGVVRDKKTGDILENALVSLIDGDNKIIAQKVALGGLYEFEQMNCNKVKFIRAEKNSYQTNEELVDTNKDGEISTDILLDLRGMETVAGTDIGLLLNPIYFNLDRHKIRPDAQVELQKVIAILQQNPNIKIDIRSHTDSRADDTYNKVLSNRRVQATINYIVANGIERSRLTGRGYGETQLVNGCSNKINCSENEHQRNRRSEFIIIK